MLVSCVAGAANSFRYRGALDLGAEDVLTRDRGSMSAERPAEVAPVVEGEAPWQLPAYEESGPTSGFLVVTNEGTAVALESHAGQSDEVPWLGPRGAAGGVGDPRARLSGGEDDHSHPGREHARCVSRIPRRSCQRAQCSASSHQLGRLRPPCGGGQTRWDCAGNPWSPKEW